MLDLDGFPRVSLGHWPTPLVPCRRLQALVGGPLIWLKRDDCSGLALGGNKTRKLEFLLGDAQGRGATGVVTFGAIQSNHARQTAAACARLGLSCDLVLTETVARRTGHHRSSGNRLLDDVFGASVHVVADGEAARRVAAELAEEHPDRHVIGPGGSNPVGALGYVAAAAELADQLTAERIEPGALVLACSTGGTAAGLVVGLAGLGLDLPITAVAVHSDAATTAASIDRLVAGTRSLLGVDDADGAHTGAEAWRVDDRALGAGYGIETEASHAAVLALARSEGVLLDPVYTAKGFAWLLAAAQEMDPADDVVFVHTGGQPGLFAYADAFA